MIVTTDEPCPVCKAPPGEPCRTETVGALLPQVHVERLVDDTIRLAERINRGDRGEIAPKPECPTPCPFCGSLDVVMTWRVVGATPAYSVVCNILPCATRGPERKTRVEALGAWERREIKRGLSFDSDAASEIDRLRAQITDLQTANTAEVERRRAAEVRTRVAEAAIEAMARWIADRSGRGAS